MGVGIDVGVDVEIEFRFDLGKLKVGARDVLDNGERRRWVKGIGHKILSSW